MANINKMIANVERVAKRIPKIVVRSMPVATVASRAIYCAQNSSDLPHAVNSFQMSYTGVDALKGEFAPQEMLKGAVPLVVSAVISKIVSSVM